MLDVHILSIPSRQGYLLERCIDSVIEAARRSPYSVDIHIVQCIEDRDIGSSRAKAYSLGSHPYVTNVDDDDWVEPNAFEVLADSLKKKPPAVYTSFYQHTRHGTRINKDRALLRVFRRDILEGFEFSKWPAKDKEGLISYADRQGGYLFIDQPVYHYNDNPLSASRRATFEHLHILSRPELKYD